MKSIVTITIGVLFLSILLCMTYIDAFVDEHVASSLSLTAQNSMRCGGVCNMDCEDVGRCSPLVPQCQEHEDCNPYVFDIVCIDYVSEEACTDPDQWDLADCRYSDDHPCEPKGKVIETCANGYCLAPSIQVPCNTNVTQCYW